MSIKKRYFSLRRSYIGVSLAVIMTLLSGCNIPIASVVQPISSPTSTPLIPQNTPAEATPTLTSTPTATMTPPGTNIVFSPGATAWVLEGTLQPGQVKSFTLAAQKNQPMILILESLYNDLSLAVYEEDGNALLPPANNWNRWQWLLPATQTYTIQAIGGSITEDFKLTVKIAAKIALSSGAATLNASTVNGYIISYFIVCQAGKTMHLTLNAPANSAYLDVFGITGNILLDQSLKATTWTGLLPSTQTYLIEVIPEAGQVVNFTLTVSVS